MGPIEQESSQVAQGLIQSAKGIGIVAGAVTALAAIGALLWRFLGPPIRRAWDAAVVGALRRDKVEFLHWLRSDALLGDYAAAAECRTIADEALDLARTALAAHEMNARAIAEQARQLEELPRVAGAMEQVAQTLVAVTEELRGLQSTSATLSGEVGKVIGIVEQMNRDGTPERRGRGRRREDHEHHEPS